MTQTMPIASDAAPRWLDDPFHRDWLRAEAGRQLDLFRASLRDDGGFDVFDRQGRPIAGAPQELHTTTRLVHSAALAMRFGHAGLDPLVDAGMAFLAGRQRDARHGGWSWSVTHDGRPVDDSKLAYGHVFVLLAAASARIAGHPQADALLDEAAGLLWSRFWEPEHGLFCDEFTRDWRPFSTYRGMNANMHGVEALLTAHEATGEALFLDRAQSILEAFLLRVAPAEGWRLPEHYTADWRVDDDYAGNPMFRPAGTTPGHSLELGRLALQAWDLRGRPADGIEPAARRLIAQALSDAWLPGGGLAYTLERGSGRVAIADRYWWPVAEAIGAVAVLLKLGGGADDEEWYRRLWRFAAARFIDPAQGGWFPEIDADGQPVERQFRGKPDLYHSLQAALFPLVPAVSRIALLAPSVPA